MILLLLLVFSALQTGSSGQYVTEIDDCIREGVNVSADSTITERNLTNRVCGFLLQADQYIVVQPNKVNISEDARIRLYLINSTNSSSSKLEIYEYYTRFLFRNPVFVGAGYQQFALVVLSKNDSRDVGQFEFVFRTNCSVEMAAEDFPIFTSPNYFPGNPILQNALTTNIGYQQCSYRIFSKTKSPFAVRFTSFQYSYWPNLQINSISVSGTSRFVFNGSKAVNVSLSTYYYNYYYYGTSNGFSAKVSSIFQDVSLKRLDERNNSGIAQISYRGVTYTLQHGSMTMIDLQVLCRNLNYGGFESIRPYENTTGLFLLSHEFQCVGAEKVLSQCNPLIRNKISFRNYYYGKPMASVVTCSDNFPVRVTSGTSSSGIVQIQIGNTWSTVCADNMDARVGDVFCREMGFGGAQDVRSYIDGYYYYYSSFYQSTGMNNIRCGDNKNLKDCSYEISKTFLDNKIKRNEISTDLYNYSNGTITDYPNNNIVYFTYCYNGAIRVTCRENKGYILNPGSHQGYLQYNDNLICLNSFNMQNAAVYCRYLGYPSIRKVYQNASFDTSWYTLINLQCRGNENSPADCPRGPVSQCTNNNAMGVVCQDIVLAGSNSTNEGRIEIFYKGRRGLLCDDYLNMDIGNVICRQLGFSYVQNVSRMAGYTYGFGNQVFLLNNIQCNGFENSIHDCYRIDYGYVNCGGNDVSGIVCQGRDGMCGINSVTERTAMSYEGYETVFGAHPWQASVSPYYESVWCSATIINKNWLLTSANCFGMTTYGFNIYVSSSEYNGNSANLVYTDSVETVIQHPEYSSVTGDYNIALVKTRNPMRYSAYVQPICRRSGDVSLIDQQCWTTGWNHRQTGSNRPLMGKLVKVMTDENCMTIAQFDKSQMSRYLCSRNSMNKSAIFNGESGGPLICNLNGTNTIVGVVARSVFGARATSIRLYSKVNSYSEWIDNTIARY